MANFKITKIQKILEVNNDMAHNYYYLIYFHLQNEDKTKYKKGKFVIWFDIFDLQEYYLEENEELRGITQEEIKQYAVEIAISDLECFYKSYEDTKELQDFCNQSITDYNRIANYY